MTRENAHAAIAVGRLSVQNDKVPIRLFAANNGSRRARSSSYRYYFIFIRSPADCGEEIVLRIIIIISTASPYPKEQKGTLYYIIIHIHALSRHDGVYYYYYRHRRV